MIVCWNVYLLTICPARTLENSLFMAYGRAVCARSPYIVANLRFTDIVSLSSYCNTGRHSWGGKEGGRGREGAVTRVGIDYKSPITITITVPIKLSITITVAIEKAITITITIIRLRLRLQLLVYHGNDSRLFIRHVHLQYYHA